MSRLLGPNTNTFKNKRKEKITGQMPSHKQVTWGSKLTFKIPDNMSQAPLEIKVIEFRMMWLQIIFSSWLRCHHWVMREFTFLVGARERKLKSFQVRGWRPDARSDSWVSTFDGLTPPGEWNWNITSAVSSAALDGGAVGITTFRAEMEWNHLVCLLFHLRMRRGGRTWREVTWFVIIRNQRLFR